MPSQKHSLRIAVGNAHHAVVHLAKLREVGLELLVGDVPLQERNPIIS